METRARSRPLQAAFLATLRGTWPVAAFLLIPAGLIAGGAWVWPRGLAFVGGYMLVQAIGNVALAIWRPASFRVRQQSVVASREKKQPLADAAGAAVLLGFLAATLIFVPLDVFRWRLLPSPPAWLSWSGGALALFGAALTPLAVWENRYATPNVQDQTDQGQQIVDTGVYGVIRHPIYLGNLLLFCGGALWLGSTAALAGGAVIAVMTAGRILIEEKDLRARLPQYASYARRVRARLIPFVI